MADRGGWMAQRGPDKSEQRIQNLTEKLLATFEELDFLHSLAAILARPGEVENLDDYLVRETATIFQADGGWIARTGEGGELALSVAHGFTAPVARFLNQRLLAPLVREGALPLLVNDLSLLLARREVVEPEAQDIGEGDLPRAFLACPLVVNTEVVGVIALGKRGVADVFTAGDQKLLSTLAIQAALFIKNATLLQRLKDEAQTLGKRVERLESDPRQHPNLSWIRGNSPAMARLVAQVESAAATGATVTWRASRPRAGAGLNLSHRIDSRRVSSCATAASMPVPPATSTESILWPRSTPR